ncbi:MAG: hypothetical protein HRU69_03155 [Flammeovirgaceae bacterium]|nr:MAG: hypothetical protein HRU69_03155 [Flammeovirgaceae bacterium]
MIALEDALEKFLSWGVKFDVLICGYERAKMHAAALADHAPLKILSYQDKENPLHTAMMFLQATKCPSVNLIGVPPEKLMLPFSDMNIVVFYAGFRWSLICNGSFEKWMKAGTQLRFISTGNLAKEGLTDDIVQTQGIVRITGNTPFWVGEPYELRMIEERTLTSTRSMGCGVLFRRMNLP